MTYEENNFEEKTNSENTQDICQDAVNPAEEEPEPVYSKEVIHQAADEADIADVFEEDTAAEELPRGNRTKGWKRELLEWVESLGVAVIVVLLLTNFVFRFVIVDGSSMEPTLHHRNQLFVYRLGYEPDNGDIIVFAPRGDKNRYYIKRVIAVEGQTVDIRNGEVYVDGERLEEDYIAAKITGEYPGQYPKTVPPDCVFVLGDNRNASRDSRDETGVGMVEEKSIVGKALFRILPITQFGGLYDNYNLK